MSLFPYSTTANPAELADYVKLLVSSKRSINVDNRGNNRQHNEEDDLVRYVKDTLLKDQTVTDDARKVDGAVRLAVKSLLVSPSETRGGDKRKWNPQNDGNAYRKNNYNRREDDIRANKNPRLSNGGLSQNRGHNRPRDNYQNNADQQHHYNSHQNQMRPHHGNSFNDPPPPPPYNSNNNNTWQPQERNHFGAVAGGTSQSATHYQNKGHSSAPPHHHHHRQSTGVNGILPPPPPPPPSSSQYHHHTQQQSFSNSRSKSENDNRRKHGQGQSNGYRGDHPHSKGQPHFHQSPNKLPENERRTLLITNVPSNMTRDDLRHYFTRKMKVKVSKIQIRHQHKSHHNSQKSNTWNCLVELATHDMTMYVYNSPDSVMGNRFIGIKIHHSNLLQHQGKSHQPSPPLRTSTSNNSHPKNHNGHYREEIPSNPSNPEGRYPNHFHNSIKPNNNNHKSNLLISKYEQQKTLLEKQESLIEKQISAHKLILSKITQKASSGETSVGGDETSSDTQDQSQITDNAGTKEMKLKEILALQKKLNQVKQQKFSILTKINEERRNIEMNPSPKPAPPRSYSLDNRTTILSASGFPKDGSVEEDAIWKHFSSFGKVLTIEKDEIKEEGKETTDISTNDGENKQDDTDTYIVTFSNRFNAEQAKLNGSNFEEGKLTLSFKWVSKKSINSNTTNSENYKDEENFSTTATTTTLASPANEEGDKTNMNGETPTESSVNEEGLKKETNIVVVGDEGDKDDIVCYSDDDSDSDEDGRWR